MSRPRCDRKRLPRLLRTAALLPPLLALLTGCRSGTPQPESFLRDEAGLFHHEAGARIERYLRFVGDRYRVDYRVVIATPAEAPPEAEAGRWYRELGVGGAMDGRGLLLWIDPERRLARLEIGYALEPLLPDLAAARVLDGYLAPYEGAGELAAAVEAAIEGVIDRFTPRLEELAAAEGPDGRGGGGAGQAFGAGRDASLAAPDEGSPAAGELVPQPDPRAVRDLELALLAAGRYEPAAAIYDDAWRLRGHRREWSPARLRELARRWTKPYEIVAEGDHAIAFAPNAPDLGPTPLARGPAGWVIDSTAREAHVVYDYSGDSWYWVDGPSPYLPLLHRAARLESVRLQDDRPAWRLAPAVPVAPEE
ncbi:MAG TPA: TPM domain-containing protein [Thermoanaerobaculia bacterium]|nr:TPM domain-containing protein [Thermoanaerobaculia bacterium]